MDKQTLDRIFDPFFTTKKFGEGTGLGLSVVHGIVKNHQGAIRISSKPGKGTTFRILLPALDRQEDRKSEPVRAAPNGHAKILFVDDEESIVQLYRQVLEGMGHTVTARTDSRKALEAFRAGPDSFDLIITDLTMPHITGVDLLRAILKIREDIPAILCTGFHDAVRPEQMDGIGFQALLMKPITTQELTETIRKVLHPETAQ